MAKRKVATKKLVDNDDFVEDPFEFKYIKRDKKRKTTQTVITDRKIELKLASGDPLTKLFLDRKEQLACANINFTDQVLPYGDVWFMDITEPNDEGLLMVWERKTQADLENSVRVDQHWCLQRDRMLEADVTTVLLIEGYSNEFPITESVIDSCIIKHSIFPLRTSGIEGSFIKVCKIYKELCKGTNLRSVRGAILKYGPEEQTARTALAMCVSMVHQATKDLGMVIQEKYKTIEGLITAFKESSTPETMLSGIIYRILPDDTTIVSPNAPLPKFRKVPLSTARRIYHFFCKPELYSNNTVKKTK